MVALLGFALARWITRPLRALECATRQLADGRLTDHPATDRGPPELRQLATSFTRTANRLQYLLRAQEAFASEASHQLKTPLTSLRLRLENFEPHLAPCAQHGLDEAIGEVGRLSRMVQGLLALTRLENSAITPEVTDLDAVVADRAAIWTAFAGEQRVDITVAESPAGPVWAVPGALEQIIDNLLSNALRASPPGSTITLATAPAPTDSGRTPLMAELHVVDQGPGMTETERQRAFDRFWRATDAHHDGTVSACPWSGGSLRPAGETSHSIEAAPGGGIDARIRLRPVRGTRIRGHSVSRAGSPHLAHAGAAGQEHGQARLLDDGAGHRAQTDGPQATVLAVARPAPAGRR